MKKFLLRLCLALVPIALYLAFFVMFEQNNYFGLDNTDTMYSRIKGYAAALPGSIIIGDSRLANFDMNLVEQASGRSWYNLAFGGATLEESLDLLEYTMDKNPKLKEVVLGLSFYTLNKSYGTVSRMATIEKQIENPIAYISNLQHNIDAVMALLNTLKGVPLGSHLETADWTQVDYEQNGKTLPYRKGLIAYSAVLYTNCAVSGVPTSALPSIDAMLAAFNNNTLNAQQLADEMLAATPAQSRFEVNEQQLERLIALSKKCTEQGINLTVVMPPMHSSVRQLVCKPLGIEAPVLNAVEKLKNNGLTLLDYEWENPPQYEDGAFFDGFHLDLKYGLPQFSQTLFNEVNKQWG